MSHLTIVLLMVAAYLVGGIPIGVLVGRARGMNIRQYGSGNIGASNVLRTLGVKAGLMVWLADVSKGFAPVAGSAYVLQRDAGLAQFELWLAAIGAAAIMGHCFSPYLKLAGGRGISTSLGVLLAIDWRVGLSAFGVWIFVALLTRYISLASVLAATSAPVFFALYTDSVYYLILGVGLAVMIVARHAPNIRRLVTGMETKIGEKGKKMSGEANGER